MEKEWRRMKGEQEWVRVGKRWARMRRMIRMMIGRGIGMMFSTRDVRKIIKGIVEGGLQGGLKEGCGVAVKKRY